MKSPFPGMDPWLEAHWGDVHARLIVEASNQLQRQDVILDLQTMIDRAYEDGGYDDLDYTADPVPPLRGKDTEAVAQLLRERHER
jgi:hypothetical protein